MGEGRDGEGMGEGVRDLVGKLGGEVCVCGGGGGGGGGKGGGSEGRMIIHNSSHIRHVCQFIMLCACVTVAPK